MALPERPARVWDCAAVHKVLHGGRRDDPLVVWAAAHGLPEPARPGDELALLDAELDPVEPYAGPLRSDGSLHPDAPRLADPDTWAGLAREVAELQEQQLLAVPDARSNRVAPHLPLVTGWAESAAALLCAELEQDGLPMDRVAAEHVLREAGAEGSREERDAPVRALLPDDDVDLRNPAQVRDALARHGIDVPDTRSWRLEAHRANPLVAALLQWRKAERLATTYGEAWLDAHLGEDGRLRGSWSAADGGAGRMTATAGLHSLPTELRSAVVAEPGHVLVRADLGQVEPRVLAVVSGDPGLARAAGADDMYTPVAEQLRCDRPTAKVAVLAAMYGQTSGTAGQALQQMERAYPKALGYLREAEEAGRVGRDVRTHGGRLVRTGTGGLGRYVRNAVVQGAAAELFKAWAAAVRNGLDGGRIVLCLHDELLLQVRSRRADAAVATLRETLASVSGHWGAGSGVRFVAEVGVGSSWAETKTVPQVRANRARTT